jgi:hypothetical protein
MATNGETRPTLKNFSKALSFIDRYFTRNYHPQDHLFYFEHSNGLILCGLSRGHPIFAEGLHIDDIEILFKPPAKEDIEGDYGNLVSGKKKRGGIKIIPTMKLFRIVCGERSFVIRSHVTAYIIEISPYVLAKNVEVIQTDPEGAGYLFIANPTSETYQVKKECKEVETVPKPW